jgi:hypothetical protein
MKKFTTVLEKGGLDQTFNFNAKVKMTDDKVFDMNFIVRAVNESEAIEKANESLKTEYVKEVIKLENTKITE